MVYSTFVGRDEADKKKLGDEGLIFLGKGYVRMGQTTSLSNNIMMDVAKPHVILIAGKRGSGKSTTIGVIAEEMSALPEEIANKLSVLIFDTMGIFWTMKFPNLRDEKLLEEWELKPMSFDVKVYTPEGFFQKYKKEGIATDYPFSLKVSELSSADWMNVFGIGLLDPVGILIERAIEDLKELYKGEYSIEDILEFIQKDKKTEQKVRDAAENRFLAARSWGLFSEKGTKIQDLTQGGKISILDVSCYSDIGGWGVKNLVIGLIARKILNERMTARKKEEMESIEEGQSLFSEEEIEEKPLVWIFIDEAHEVLSRKETTAATDALVKLLREGRQPGISLVLATQQPGEIHTDVMTQSDIVISHRLTAKRDIEALNRMMQSYLTGDLQKYLNQLPRLKGSAILLDDNSERIYPMRVRPKLSWHGGESPSAIKKKKEFLGLEL